MIKKFKCEYCQQFYTKAELDGQFVCPECYQQIDPKNFKIFNSKKKSNYDDDYDDEQYDDYDEQYDEDLNDQDEDY